MKKKIYLHTQFWTDPCIRNLSHGAKLLAAYCLIGSHRLTRQPQKMSLITAQADLNWSLEVLKDRLAELSQKNLITHSPEHSAIDISPSFQHAFSKVTAQKTAIAFTNQ